MKTPPVHWQLVEPVRHRIYTAIRRFCLPSSIFLPYFDACPIYSIFRWTPNFFHNSDIST